MCVARSVTAAPPALLSCVNLIAATAGSVQEIAQDLDRVKRFGDSVNLAGDGPLAVEDRRRLSAQGSDLLGTQRSNTPNRTAVPRQASAIFF
jgi:hypothetical protein